MVQVWPIRESKTTGIASYFADFANEVLAKDELKLRCKNVKLFLSEPLVRYIALTVYQRAHPWQNCTPMLTGADFNSLIALFRFIQRTMNNSANELSRRVTITNDLGIHARSAAKIAKLVQNATSNVWIIKDGKKADASSIIDILTLVCPKGSIIKLTIDDQSDLWILNDLVQLIESGFGE